MTTTPKKISKTNRTSARKGDNDRALYLASLLENISDALISTDREFKVLEWNAAAEKMYGWKAAEVLGHPAMEFIHTEYLETTRDAVIQTVVERGVWRGEATQDRRDGTRFPVAVSISLIKDETDGPIGFVAINRDITERKQVDEQLRHSEERFSKAFHSAPTALMLTRLPDSKLEYVNESFLRLTGYQVENVIGKTPPELNLITDLDDLRTIRQTLLERQRIRDFETTFRTSSGEIRYVLFSSEFLRLDQEAYGLTTMVDITERVHAEKQVIQMKRLYATLSQVNQTIVRVKDREDLYQSICDVAVQFGEISAAWVGLLDETTGDIGPVAANGLDVKPWPMPIVNIHTGPLSEGLIAQAFHTSRVVTSDNVQTNAHLQILHDQFQKYGFHASAVIPFRLRDKTIGTLTLIAQEEGLFRDAEEVRLLDEMGLDISFALDMMENEKERRQAEEKVERQNQRLLVLREIDLAILAANSVESIIGAALSHIRELIDCRRANLTLIDRATDELVIFEVRAVGETSIPAGSRLPVAQFADIIQTLSRNQPIVFSDYRTLVDPMPGIQRLLKDGLLSTCSLPLLSQGSLIGMFSMHSEIPGFFDDDKIALGREVANQVAIALTHNHLVEGLRESEEKYRAFFENSMDAILLTSPDGSIQAANPAACKMLGRTEAEICALSRSELVDTNDPRVGVLLEERAKTGKTFGELTMFRNDASPFPVEMSSALFQDRQGSTRTSMIIRDITERKRAEQQIQSHLRRLNALHTIDTAISSGFDLGVTLDVVLRQVLSQLGADAAAILLVNSNEQTIEYAASQGFRSNVLHHTQLKLDKGYAGRAVLERATIHIAGLMEPGGSLPGSPLLEHETFVDYYATPLIVQGEVEGVLEIYHRTALDPDPEWLDFLETLAGQAAIAIDSALLFRDLQRANAELEERVAKRTEELNKTNVELEHANRAKDEFLANMSHELRTPLNSILGLSETLLEQRRDPLSENQQRYIQTIATGGQHLLDLINDILDLSKIEAGKFDYFPQPISVDEICRSTLAFVKAQALKKSIAVTYVQDIPVAKIFADPRRLKQILVNLLTNAVKFTPEKGEVILQVNADKEKDLIQFAVIDTGIGIAPEHLQKLFQPFVQVESGLNRQQEGTGLGLALVQRLTDLHGGSVQVDSAVGQGSRFTINLPLGQSRIAQEEGIESGANLLSSPQNEISNTSSGKQLDHGTILLAEDNLANILTIGDYLESHGYQVVVANDGLEAIEKAETIQPDLILMDIQMPGVDGLEATRHLRANPRFASTPIIALTALAMPGDRERCLEAGATEYMSKPVGLKMLIKTIRDLLAK